MKLYDSMFLQEQEKFVKAKENYDKVFSEGNMKSKLSDIKVDFVGKFNELAKFLLTSNKKIEVFSREGYNGKMYIGGKSGITHRDYGGEGLTQQGVVDFFTNLDKIDIKLRQELTKHYYDKWLSFVSCFGGGVEKILLSKSDKKSDGLSLRKSRLYSNDVILLPNKYISDEKDDGLVGVARLSEIFIEDFGSEISCKVKLDNDNIVELDDDDNLCFFRDYLNDMVELAGEYAKDELVIYSQQKSQFDVFIKKVTPYLSLGDL